jgi:hypothetical protein
MTMPISDSYTMQADGREIMVYHTETADFAIICCSGFVDVAINAKKAFDCAVAVRPSRKNYGMRLSGGEILLWLSCGDRVSVEPYGLYNPLFVFCVEYIEKPAHATHVFGRGTFTEIGTVELKSGDCVYIEEGAVVVGYLHADRANDIEITGNGIIWGLPLQGPGKKRVRTIRPIECENVKISGVTMADAPSWNITPVACKNVSIDGVNIISVLMSSDGIDIVGCEDVRITGCFVCVNDDCLALKAVRYDDTRGTRDVKNVIAADCVLWKLKCGNAIEIGYETSCTEICDVLFENIDVIHCEYEGWQSGAVFSIHNGDRGHVHNIRYRNIYIEDASEKLIDLKILSSVYSVDKWRGNISDIFFDGIYVTGDVLPPSIIRGYLPDERGAEPQLIKNVSVRNLYLNGVKVTGRMHAHAVVELSENVTFE